MLSAKYSIYISSASVWIDFFFSPHDGSCYFVSSYAWVFFNLMPDIMNFTFW